MQLRLFSVTFASLGPTRLDLCVCLNWVMAGGIMALVRSKLAQMKVRNVGRIGVPYSENWHIVLHCCGGVYRSVAQLARAAVSKTAGRGFESSHSCHNKAPTAEVVELVDTRS